MKRTNYIAATCMFIPFLFACTAKQPTMQMNNTSNYDLVEKPIAIDRAQIEAKYGTISDSLIPFLKDQDGNLTPCQFEDWTLDGQWDQLFTLIDIKANEQKSYQLLLLTKEEAPEIKTRTNIRFADINDTNKEFKTAERLKSNVTEISQTYFQFEGPGWENDVVGFRNYFDARNGIDIFGKCSSGMALDECGVKGGSTYHELNDWGMDILKVANSLGAGSLALETENGLYRVGDSCDGTFTLICEGPLRSTFDLDFENIKIEGQNISLKHRICIVAGKPWYKSIVSVKNSNGVKLVSGIVNLQSDSVYSKSKDAYSYMYTHDNQAYSGEKLGMGIFALNPTMGIKAAPEEGEGITQTFYTEFEVKEEPTIFFFMAGWELQDPKWADRSEFEKGLDLEAKAIASQIDIKIL